MVYKSKKIRLNIAEARLQLFKGGKPPYRPARPYFQDTHRLLQAFILMFMPPTFTVDEIHRCLASFGWNFSRESLYNHITGREKGNASEGFRKAHGGFLQEGLLEARKRAYKIKVPRPSYSTKLLTFRTLRASNFSEMIYDLNLQREDVRFDELAKAYEIDCVRGWRLKASFDSDLRIVVLKHLLRGVLLGFVESDANLEEIKETRSHTKWKMRWVLDPLYLVEPAKLREISEKDYSHIIQQVWERLEIKSVPNKSTNAGILVLIDLNSLYSTLHTQQGRKILIEALNEANEDYKQHLRHMKDLHEPLVYPKHFKPTWLRNS